MAMTIRTYSELSRIQGLTARYEYLALGDNIGECTFGFNRWVNQDFYRSREWQSARRIVIARDEGYDLGDRETPIIGAHLVHHMNPLTLQDLEEGSDNLLDPEGLITCALRTHNAIHFGDKSLLPQPYVERRPGDTQLWVRKF